MNAGKRGTVALVLAVAIVAPFEGLRNYAYRDPVGIPTICYGSIQGVRMGDYRTTAECKALLGDELWQRVLTVERCVPGLPVNMLAAWASAIYNVGDHLVCSVASSTAARLLKAGRWVEACQQLPRWDKARVAGVLTTLPGLARRRAAEMALCLTPEGAP